MPRIGRLDIRLLPPRVPIPHEYVNRSSIERRFIGLIAIDAFGGAIFHRRAYRQGVAISADGNGVSEERAARAELRACASVRRLDVRSLLQRLRMTVNNQNGRYEENEECFQCRFSPGRALFV